MLAAPPFFSFFAAPVTGAAVAGPGDTHVLHLVLCGFPGGSSTLEGSPGAGAWFKVRSLFPWPVYRKAGYVPTHVIMQEAANTEAESYFFFVFCFVATLVCLGGWGDFQAMDRIQGWPMPQQHST